MEPSVSYGLWYVDSLDQFSRTIAVADGRPGGKLTKGGGGRAKKTSVCLHPSGEATHVNETRQPALVKAYQLRVSLRLVTPMVWRRLLVASTTTIAQLHATLQIALGWEDLHLHQFRIHGKAYGVSRDGGMSFGDDPHKVHLADFKLRKGERFVYEYDMGVFA